MNRDNRITIKLTVDQRVFEIDINKEGEFYYREAERIINESFTQFAKRWTYNDHQDLLSKILIDFVVRWIENEERLNAFEEDLIPKMEALKALTDTIEID
jgi:hypothetical protein